jgi:hypothetical protein
MITPRRLDGRLAVYGAVESVKEPTGFEPLTGCLRITGNNMLATSSLVQSQEIVPDV